jgi:hypothetical protein
MLTKLCESKGGAIITEAPSTREQAIMNVLGLSKLMMLLDSGFIDKVR